MGRFKVIDAPYPSHQPTREEIISANPLPRFLAQRGYELRKAGSNFVTNACPVAEHKNYHRCNTIDPEKNLWHCNDCKRGGTVIDWVMIEKNVNAADAMRMLAVRRNASEPKRLLIKTYDYTDENGKLLFQVCRYQPKHFKQRQPDGKGGWAWNLEGVRRVLYRLPEVIKAQTVVIAEGEKDADNLNSLGFTATTNPMGAGRWRDEYSEALPGKDVVIFGDVGDEDGEGERHTAQRIESLNDVAHSIKHVTLPDGFHDISDYIASLPAERATETIHKLIDETPEVDFKSGNFADVDEPEIELPPLPAPYVPPPLTLLPSVLQDYVHAAAESLKRDVSFLFLPKLSALGAAIGNSRSILLKRGYIQPPNIWTGIINPTGTLKSASIEEGCFAVVEHEQKLGRLNREAAEIYVEELATWEAKSKKLRGPKPKPPEIQTCMMDDLTLEALADRLQSNPRGVLIAKDEISGWFESFDLYRNKKGADVSRWLSSHTGAHFGIDRRTDNRHQRIWLPRVCITGGVQPKVFRRLMKPDYFERGLPARFIFAAPPPLQLKWTEATIPEELRQAVRNLFEELWLLLPEHDYHGQPYPKLLRLTEEAREVYIPFYNECGVSALESDEYEAGAWCKLPGYAARFALVGQLARNAAARDSALLDPEKPLVTGETMQTACDLARWSGKETARIYAQLAETLEQRGLRELTEFVQGRGGEVSVRETMQNFRPLKNQHDEIEKRFYALVKAGRGKWKMVPTRTKPGRKFQLLAVSTSTDSIHLRGEIAKSVDVDSSNSQKITPATPPDAEPAGVSVPLMITRQMEAELLRRGFTQAKINKLTPPEAHAILATPATPASGSDQEIAADFVIGEDPEGETIL
jgi:hypothetical protein